HYRGEAISRELDALDFLRSRVQLNERFLEAVERGMDGVAAGVEPEVIARDLPAAAQLVGEPSRIETVPGQLAESLFDGILLRLEARESELGRERADEPAHAAGDVERSRPGDRVGVARREELRRRDAHGAAHAARVEPAQARAGGSRGKQVHLSILVREGP